MENDLNRIGKLAQVKEDENLDFMLFLKSCNHHQVDKLVHQLNEKYLKEFDCTECGNCCKKLIPLLSVEEIKKITEHLELSYEDFEVKYIERETSQGIILKGQKCPFLYNNKCSIYDYRPEVCRSYPHLHKDNINHRLLELIDNSFLCPIVYNILEDLKNSLNYIQNLKL